MTVLGSNTGWIMVHGHTSSQLEVIHLQFHLQQPFLPELTAVALEYLVTVIIVVGVQHYSILIMSQESAVPPILSSDSKFGLTTPALLGQDGSSMIYP